MKKIILIIFFVITIITINILGIYNYSKKIYDNTYSKNYIEYNIPNINIEKFKINKVKIKQIFKKEKQNKILQQKILKETSHKKHINELRKKEKEKQIKKQQEKKYHIYKPNYKSHSYSTYSRGGNLKVRLTLSHYGDTFEENGNNGYNALCRKLRRGDAASNNFVLGTKIYVSKYNRTFTITDTGRKDVLKRLEDGSIKIDIFVPRYEDENNEHYKKRISDLGIIKTYGYIVR